jgi:anhydro-N-acetylmuramic acid kinase
MLIDGAVSQLTANRQTFDYNGERAARGQVSQLLVRELLAHPFLHRPPPKSTGREAFGGAFLDQILRRAAELGVMGDDLIATVTAFTAATMADAYRRFILHQHPQIESILCGGGSHNLGLRDWLRHELPTVAWRMSDEFGISADALEAVIFGVLAYETVRGRVTNVPTATGATQAVILGKVVPGRDGWRSLQRLWGSAAAAWP